jgi:hypothetical protein
MEIQSKFHDTKSSDGETPLAIRNGKINLTSDCNSDCYCSGIPYTPVCRESTGDTFFNPCYASCGNYSKEEKVKLADVGSS